MNTFENDASPSQAAADSSASENAPSEHDPPVAASPQPTQAREDRRRLLVKLLIQPALFLAAGAILIAGLGVAQRFGLISSGGGAGHAAATTSDSSVRYICPMMCTPPQSEPGRCPVCAMELVPATSEGGNADSRSVQIDPAARRIANIRTVAVQAMPVQRAIHAIGELNYDEGSLKTISAYVDGRLDRLYADFTGVVVQRGDPLALLYSPELYSGQVELLTAKQFRDKQLLSTTVPGTRQYENDVYTSARERLVALGMTELQIKELEASRKAESRIHLSAPISGTVIEKVAVEGQYVTKGDVICRLADLSTVWLMLELFPKDAAAIRYGQQVEAEVQSLPGQTFVGRVAFIDPKVDPKTRTVGVRVVIPNRDGILRVGDYAKATIDVALHDARTVVYDPELAGKWISPRHPHVISASAGPCPICGIDLVPAEQFGFADQPVVSGQALVVPRDAVLMVGNHSVIYVETEPGRFEMRQVTLGPNLGEQIVILDGVQEGEQVATRGNFLIDSQMQLAGNPSLIDPTKAEPKRDTALSAEALAALAKLSPEDRALAEQQGMCPVADFQLGAMGTPRKVDVNGRPVFICCEGCRENLLSEPEKYLAKLAAKPAIDNSPPHVSPVTAPQMDLPPIELPQLIEPEETPGMFNRGAHQRPESPRRSSHRIAESHREVLR